MEDYSIGGFIELEFDKGNGLYHTNAVSLSNGRACFHLFLNIFKPKKIYLPYYTCNTLIDPILKSKTTFEFYGIDQNLDPKFDKGLKDDEYLLYINYLDVKNKTVLKLEKTYGPKLIVDNTQAFYHKQYKSAIASFNSCRKFFGVPDGGYLYLKKKIERKFKPNENFILDHLVSRVFGKTDTYYIQFLENEKLMNPNITGMSLFTNAILNQIDYTRCKNQRTENFNYLNYYLSKHNNCRIDIDSVNVPYAYPFLPNKYIDRTKFYNKRLFISTLWMDVLNRKNTGFKTEKHLSTNLLPLPIDQRYSQKEMEIILNTLKPYL